MQLDKADRNQLLAIARGSIKTVLTGMEHPELDDVQSEALKQKRGVFVTLKKKGQLRGCIGYMQGARPLCEAVSDMARAAAFDDPRFPPLRRDEVDDLAIEISVLTPLEEIHGPEEIVVGRHGVYLVKGRYTGVLLPQVAVEYNWDRLTFLEETCHKAGLSADGWKDAGVKLYKFSADIFGDDE
jgi:AmmeMemoRadiSam system protein A